MNAKHWQREDRDDMAVLTLDVAERSANVLSDEVLLELEALLVELKEQLPKGVVIRSGKRGHFIVGADVTMFEHIETAEQAKTLAQNGQRVFDQLAALDCPTVAVIHGQCLGGGLELALACDYRVAREDPGTRLGLPEVRLGINPGFGGTVRLPRLIGPLPALDMMLTGRSLSASAARRLGLVDEKVPERHLLHAAFALAAKRPRRRLSWLKRLPAAAPLRPWVVRLLEKKVREKANPDHYPAPYRILDLWKHAAGLEAEAASLGELLVGRTSRNLVHVFLLGEALKRKGRQRPCDIERLHVVGAGVMGGDIAAWAAFKGFRVSLQDQREEAVARALKRAHAFFKKKLKKPHLIQEAMDRLMPDVAGHGLHRADLVIEAIIENEEAKKQLFAQVEQRARPEALLATNTSSIPLETIGQALKDPARLVGLHFFNPVAKMQLVEIVRGAHSGEEALGRARAFTVAIDRLPLDVKSSPGFLVNRILMPYLIEAMTMVEEGISITQIDEAAVAFGMPMGPVHLADTVGLDICLSVAEELSGPLGVPVPEGLRKMVEQGRLGKKSGRGFYTYDKAGRPKRPPRGKSSSVPISERLILRLLNEAMACLREGVVEDRDAVDAGMVYGTGFAPYLGGPMRYAESLGGAGISHSLYRLSEEYGKRFTPDEGWSKPEYLGAAQG